jgi:hypothetical protein
MKEKVYAGIGARVLPSSVVYGDIMRVAKRFKNKGWRLRSGGAIGSDHAFEYGAREASDIYFAWDTPYLRLGRAIISPELPNWEEALKISEQYHPAWRKLTDGVKALHGRNSHIILGDDLNSPVSLVICYTKNGEEIGGTAQGMRLAKAFNIPILNLFHENIKQKLLQF